MPSRSSSRAVIESGGRKRGATAKAPESGSPEDVRLFVSYSHADDAARVKMEKHLAALKREGVSTWFDGDLNAGAELDPAIARELRRAHIFVALISSDYLASDYCWRKEYLRAMGRRARGAMHVIGVVLRPCDWKSTSAARFKLLPKDGRAVSNWRSADDAFVDVCAGIRGVVKQVRMERVTAARTSVGHASDKKRAERPVRAVKIAVSASTRAEKDLKPKQARKRPQSSKKSGAQTKRSVAKRSAPKRTD